MYTGTPAIGINGIGCMRKPPELHYRSETFYLQSLTEGKRFIDTRQETRLVVGLRAYAFKTLTFEPFGPSPLDPFLFLGGAYVTLVEGGTTIKRVEGVPLTRLVNDPTGLPQNKHTIPYALNRVPINLAASYVNYRTTGLGVVALEVFFDE